jgi:hypothetical protein
MPSLVIDPITEAEIYIRTALMDNPTLVSIFSSFIGTHPGPRRESDGTPLTYPILTYTHIGGFSDTILVGGETFQSRLRFLIRGITDTNDQMLVSPGVVEIQRALHFTSGYTDNATISACYRDKPFKMIEITNSAEYIHLGGEYIIHINGNYS